MDVASLAVAAQGGPGSREPLARGEGSAGLAAPPVFGGEPAERWRFAEIQTVERRIVQVGVERRNDVELQQQISTYVAGIVDLQQGRHELETVGMRLRVTEAELETARDGLRLEYDEAKQYLNHEKSEYEQQIRRARHAATTHIQQELQQCVVERDAAMVRSRDVHNAEMRVLDAEANHVLVTGRAENELRSEVGAIKRARDTLQAEWTEATEQVQSAEAKVQQRGIAKDQDFERLKAEASDLNFKSQEESEIAQLARRRLTTRAQSSDAQLRGELNDGAMKCEMVEADASRQIAAAWAECDMKALHNTEKEYYEHEVDELRAESRELRDEKAALARAAQELMDIQAPGPHEHEYAEGHWEQQDDMDFVSRTGPVDPGPAVPPGLSRQSAATPGASSQDAGIAAAMMEFMRQMADQQRAGVEEQSALLRGLTRAQESLAEAQRESQSKLKPAKPSLTGKDASTLKVELEKFRTYQNEARQNSKAIWFEGARAIAEGTAKIELEDMIVTEMGGEEAFQKLVRVRDDPRWDLYWSRYGAV
ncbi:unnamed protein product, partial [Prorocentrum cordatum]